MVRRIWRKALPYAKVISFLIPSKVLLVLRVPSLLVTFNFVMVHKLAVGRSYYSKLEADNESMALRDGHLSSSFHSCHTL